MTTDNPLVSIVIINFNGKEFLKPCLDSVLNLNYKNFEIIFVDNGSYDGSVEFVRNNYKAKRNFILIECKKNLGVPGGRNIGLRQAKGEFIAFLDNDAVIDKNWIEGFLESFRYDNKIGIAQSKILNMVKQRHYDHAGDYLSQFGFLYERSNGALDIGQFDNFDYIFNAKGAAFMVKKELFEQIGEFDESYFMYLEETDFCWRAWLSGYRVVFAPNSVAWHAFGTPLKDDKKYYSNYVVRYYGCRNYLITTIKNADFFHLWHFLPLQIISFLSIATIFILKIRMKDAFYIVKGLVSIIIDSPFIFRKRIIIQKKIRKIKDKDYFNIILKKISLMHYLRKTHCYVWEHHN